MFKRRNHSDEHLAGFNASGAGDDTLSDAVEPFSYQAGCGETPRVVFASPHSGRVYPRDLCDAIRVPLIDLRRIEDAYVDHLFKHVPDLGGGLLTATYARAYVDLNRAKDELDSRMFRDGPPTPAGERTPRVEAGLGCIPRVGARGVEIYARKLRRREAERRLEAAYDPYHSKLSCVMEDVADVWGGSVLIDCHSMPSSCFGRTFSADFVLGDRFGASCCGDLTRFVERYLTRRGYRVQRNSPYAGGYVTEAMGVPIENRHALQIEINRSLYLDEANVAPSGDFDCLQKDMTDLAADIIQWVQTELLPKKKPRQSGAA